ncbi:MAG: type I glutamate--ammonia ligase [Acutalibacteraceae bacterium]|nr:type I glutamate--ammonia ligase [Clostridia bacterium]MEE0981638.1 type I glutamate--ammonia ligase [Acutalibacteraceae bacterium]
MGKYTKEDILRLAKEQNVRFVRLQFTDILGCMKNVAITINQLERALNNECMADGSSIEGFVRVEESDMYLYPDYDSFVVLPWEHERFGTTARLICDVYNADRTPFIGDPRNVLKRAIEKADKMGYTFNVGPELEFFLFYNDEEGRPTTKTHDRGGYFDLDNVDLGGNCRRDMCIALEDMGFEIEASHHECAEGQHEIDFKYGDVLDVADKVMTFKYVVKKYAQLHGLYATFLPKPIYGIAGSGMHTNMSLFDKDGNNAFYDPDGEFGLSDTALHFIAGIMKHIRATTAINNPLVNSYKRLVPGYEAPVYIAWSASNRSALVRVPKARGKGTRIELRSADPACNPYLEMALCLLAGLDGIEKGYMPPKSTVKNIFDMTPEEREADGITSLPGSLEEAVDAFEASDFIKESLGEHVYTKFIEAKRKEWEGYRTSISQWEIDTYLAKY